MFVDACPGLTGLDGTQLQTSLRKTRHETGMARPRALLREGVPKPVHTLLLETTTVAADQAALGYLFKTREVLLK